MGEFMDALKAAQEAFKPVFDEMNAEWEREKPAVMARADSLGITIDGIGGNCPVQAEGSFDEQRFYFRARHDEWSLNVWTGTDRYLDAPNPDEWETEKEYDGPSAGWMPRHEAVNFICDGVEQYRAEKPQ